LLTLFLGWIGLAIVYFGQERTRAAAGRALDPPAPTAPAGDDVQTRLRRLDDLRTQGLISEAERAQRRQAILDQI
jgi:hypothetical protein